MNTVNTLWLLQKSLQKKLRSPQKNKTKKAHKQKQKNQKKTKNKNKKPRDNEGGLRSQLFSSHTAVIKFLTENLFHSSSEAGLLHSREWKIYLSTERAGEREYTKKKKKAKKSTRANDTKAT